MATFTSKATGNWDTEGTTTWNEANHPVAGDTVTIQNGHTVTLDSAAACAILTIDAGGVLTDAVGNYGITITGATTVNGTLTCGAGSMDLQALTIGDGGLYTNATATSEINGNAIIGGGASGAMTAAGGHIYFKGATIVINAGATLGSADTDYDIDFYASLSTSDGTFIAPNASGNFVIRTGSTWIEPATLTLSDGEVTIIGSGTATLGSDAGFNNMEVANFATLSVGSYVLTLAGDLSIGGGVSGAVVPTTGTITVNGAAHIGTGGVLGANTAYTLALNGNLTSSSGTLAAPTADGTFTFAGSSFFTPTFTHNSGKITFSRAGTTSLSNDATQFFDVTINNGTTLDTASDRALTIAGDLVISGVLACNASQVTCAGNVTVTGTLTPETSEFVLTGTSQELSGSMDFWSFTKSVAAADTITFDNAATYTFGGDVTLNGASGELLSLVSDSAGNAFDFVLSAGANKTNLSFLSVRDSDASGSHASQKPIAPTDSIDVSGNTGWFRYAKQALTLSYYY